MTDITDDVIDGVPYYAVVCALVWMCQQYLERDDGRIDHRFMSAGEAACTVLERLGLLVDDRLIDNSDDEFWLQSRLRQRERQTVAVPDGWKPLTRFGQVSVGDQVRFTIGEEHFHEKAKQILHAGTLGEEVIYNVKKNYYFITSMALAGKSNAKNVEVLSAAPPCVGFYNKRTGELKAIVTSDDGSLDDWVDVYPAPDCPHPIVEELTKE
jgi:hypothetical protein